MQVVCHKLNCKQFFYSLLEPLRVDAYQKVVLVPVASCVCKLARCMRNCTYILVRGFAIERIRLSHGTQVSVLLGAEGVESG